MSELKGCYALLMELKNDTEIEVGALGPLHFSNGHYLYIGSAQNGIEGRVQRHLRKEISLAYRLFFKKGQCFCTLLQRSKKEFRMSNRQKTIKTV